MERTKTDTIAASFGTVHGIYISEPNLDFKRLEEIYQNTNRPIVMHGGSGLSEEDYIKAINAGVRKINYYSYAAREGAIAVKEYIEKQHHSTLFYHDLTVVAKEAIKKNVKSENQCSTNVSFDRHLT